jgi:uncharacterized protein (TIGR03435 family)
MRLAILVMLPALHAQDFTHFDAATVKPSQATETTPPMLDGGPGTKSPGRISYYGIPLVVLIRRAYGLRDFQLPSLPPASVVPRYDIVATFPAATQQQFDAMLRNLVTDRFNLRFHNETRNVSVYALTVGASGAKLKESPKLAELPPIPAGTVIGEKGKDGFPTLPPGFTGVVGFPSNGHMYLSGQRVPLSKLTPWLENSLDHPIVDQTGLAGDYDFTIDFEWPQSRVTSDADPAPSVPSAVQHDLGLKLEAKKVPFDIMVIDHLDTAPAAN